MGDERDLLGDSKRNCLWCEHFYFEPGHPGYSELTPGYDSCFGCNKHHWDNGDIDSREDFCKCMEQGLACADYKQAPREEEKGETTDVTN